MGENKNLWLEPPWKAPRWSKVQMGENKTPWLEPPGRHIDGPKCKWAKIKPHGWCPLEGTSMVQSANGRK